MTTFRITRAGPSNSSTPTTTPTAAFTSVPTPAPQYNPCVQSLCDTVSTICVPGVVEHGTLGFDYSCTCRANLRPVNFTTCAEELSDAESVKSTMVASALAMVGVMATLLLVSLTREPKSGESVVSQSSKTTRRAANIVRGVRNDSAVFLLAISTIAPFVVMRQGDPEHWRLFLFPALIACSSMDLWIVRMEWKSMVEAVSKLPLIRRVGELQNSGMSIVFGVGDLQTWGVQSSTDVEAFEHGMKMEFAAFQNAVLFALSMKRFVSVSRFDTIASYTLWTSLLMIAIVITDCVWQLTSQQQGVWTLQILCLVHLWISVLDAQLRRSRRCEYEVLLADYAKHSGTTTYEVETLKKLIQEDSHAEWIEGHQGRKERVRLLLKKWSTGVDWCASRFSESLQSDDEQLQVVNVVATDFKMSKHLPQPKSIRI